MIIFFVITLFYVFVIILSIQPSKHSNINTIEKLNSVFKNKNTKYKYLNLSKSNCNQLFKYATARKSQIYVLQEIYKNQKFYFTLSKFIDFKINTNKNKFRAKENNVFIESIADVLLCDFDKNNSPKIFSNYKKLSKDFSVLKKENKVFKFLIGQRLIKKLCCICNEIEAVSKVINKSKNAKCIKKYKNSIHFYAEWYGVLQFNKNSNFLKIRYSSNFPPSITPLFLMFENKKRMVNQITTYLMLMFN